jgi:hypothetical protein
MNNEQYTLCVAIRLLKQSPIERALSFNTLDKNYANFFREIRTPKTKGVGFKFLDGSEKPFGLYKRS